jgi:hypothetical protein
MTERELPDAVIIDQALALSDYVRRGGAASRWLDSKGFAPGDRAAIVLALGDLEAPESAA